MGMDKVPWVGNGWVQLTHAQLWVGYGYSCQTQCRTLLHKLEISLEACNNVKNSLWHTWNFTLSTTQKAFFHTPQTFNESKNSLPHTFTLKFDIFKKFKNKFFTLEKLTALRRNLFHTSHSFRNGLLFSLQPCKLKAFPQKDSLFLCYTS
jgi:hypothetical protein